MALSVLGGLLASIVALVPGPGLGAPDRSTSWIGWPPASAQADMDVDIFGSAFADLPLEVEPGQQFEVTVTTAAGAGCSGQVELREQPPIELEARPAPGGTCAWPVDVPLTARPGTGTVTVNVARNGQGWTIAGVIYVRPVGE